ARRPRAAPKECRALRSGPPRAEDPPARESETGRWGPRRSWLSSEFETHHHITLDRVTVLGGWFKMPAGQRLGGSLGQPAVTIRIFHAGDTTTPIDAGQQLDRVIGIGEIDVGKRRERVSNWIGRNESFGFGGTCKAAKQRDFANALPGRHRFDKGGN